MITIVICDDDTFFVALFAKKLKTLCDEICPCEADIHLETFTSTKDLLQYADSHPIHIIFLDIEMDTMDGFQIASFLKKNNQELIIIFVSSHDDYVYSLSCFTSAPFCFLRKSHLNDSLPSVLKAALEKNYRQNQTVLLQTISGLVTIPVCTIYYCEYEKNYITVHCTSGTTYRCRSSLRDFEKSMLPYNCITRCNSGCLINITYIRKIDTRTHTVQLNNCKTISVSRKQWKIVKSAYTQLCYKEVCL